jgi:P27 family predicted phage terminase small subunit
MATGRPGGRPPKPNEVKRALGNPGGGPLPAPPAPGEGLPAAVSVPSAPELQAAGRQLWEEVWSAGRRWLSVESDHRIVLMLCQAHDEAEVCRLMLARGDVPRFYELPNGSFVTHPIVVQLKDLRTQMTAWLAALGFSPADRARLGLGEVRVVDALDELKARRSERRAVE